MKEQQKLNQQTDTIWGLAFLLTLFSHAIVVAAVVAIICSMWNPMWHRACDLFSDRGWKKKIFVFIFIISLSFFFFLILFYIFCKCKLCSAMCVHRAHLQIQLNTTKMNHFWPFTVAVRTSQIHCNLCSTNIQFWI